MNLVQLGLYSDHLSTHHDAVECPDEISTLLSRGSPVAIGVSGGKDSSALALATTAFLDDMSHAGPRVLIHSDLESIEWQQSISVCESLAQRLRLELIVVRRKKGGLIERWRQRWTDNVRRYANLQSVQLILPWSTPQMRFCTSELKQQVICQELVRRFPGSVIISASGIRRQESAARAQAPVVRVQPLLRRTRLNTSGYDWHPILGWTEAEVYEFLRRHGVPLHQAYTLYRSSRLSCAFCMLASRSDLLAASRCEANAEAYRQIVQLELDSTFSFQAGYWLADIAPHLLAREWRERVPEVKRRALLRERAEAEIPKSLWYTEGWPTRIPDIWEAAHLADVRRRVAEAVDIRIAYVEPIEIITKYRQLIEQAR